MTSEAPATRTRGEQQELPGLPPKRNQECWHCDDKFTKRGLGNHLNAVEREERAARREQLDLGLKLAAAFIAGVVVGAALNLRMFLGV